jgi:hypothetical protein
MKQPQFVICVDNSGYAASLELRKVYELVKDPEAEKEGYFRIIDESGEDYLYGADRFVKVSLPKDVKAAVIRAA